jgi:Ca-activated chloride channel homolog
VNQLRRLAFVVTAAAGVLVAVAGPAAQRLPAFRSAIDLTTVTATVLDRNGVLVTGLERDAFDVYEDGELQTVTQFTNARVPVSLAILLDVSDSMYGRRIQDARLAIEQFVAELLDRGDEFSILVFNHQQHLLTTWTSEPALAAEVMQSLQPFGSTAIYDAILSALPLVEVRHRERAALLVISDGADTASDQTLRDVRLALLRTDAFVYAIAIDPPDRRPINVPINPSALAEITDQSGGRTTVVHTSSDVSEALAGIANELNSQYLIGYSSSRGVDGRYHSIRVRVRGTDHRVRARNGYVADPRN